MPHFYLQAIEKDLKATLQKLDRDDVVLRIWAKDHTVWNRDAAEIENRLGWLDLVRRPQPRDRQLESFVDDVRRSGLRDAVLLGMGGSSLGAEALRDSFGPRQGFPRLYVLDSTHPTWVRRVRQAIDPVSTLFLVASKSGTTAEAMALFHYFWGEAEPLLGPSTGEHFAAITDPGTALAKLGEERGFRAVFTNPPEIGGRFSVLSRFGTVAAALTGIRPKGLLNRGHAMAQRCLAGHKLSDNPGVWLGAVLGAAAAAGRDKLTLLTSRRTASFGLWVEQLIAESTGKNARGIVPVIGEPVGRPEHYGDDRLFVVVRYGPEPDPHLDRAVEALIEAGQPLIDYELWGLYDLGAELFRWQLATAVAGHVLGVHPFDQPDVEATKKETRRKLEQGDAAELPAVGDDLVAALAEGDPSYVALMAYADASPQLEQALGKLRYRLLAGRGLATTFGYGPRFLHSTGQLHKGGPEGGLFVQLVAPAATELPIPGQPHGFGQLIGAQADGDLAVLAGQGRRCLRLDLGGDPAAAVEQLTARLAS